MPNFTLPRGERSAKVHGIGLYLASLDHEKTYTVTVEEVRPKRSLDQNSLLWALYQQILDRGGEMMGGWSKDDLHSFFLEQHFGSIEKELAGRLVTVPGRRSSKLNKQEFSDFVDSIVQFMASQGVNLDMPGDSW